MAAGIRQSFAAGRRPAPVRPYDPFEPATGGKGKAAHKAGKPPSAMNTDLVPRLGRGVAAQTLGRPKLFNNLTKLFARSRLILMFEGDAARAADEDRAARAIFAKLQAIDLGEEPGRHWYAKRYDVSYRMSKVIDAGAFADTMEVATTWDKVYGVYEKVKAAASAHASAGPAAGETARRPRRGTACPSPPLRTPRAARPRCRPASLRAPASSPTRRRR